MEFNGNTSQWLSEMLKMMYKLTPKAKTFDRMRNVMETVITGHKILGRVFNYPFSL